ncbi:glycosyltransferase family 2 protein [Bifidobacterium simiarum]|nr:glycosyltransferase family 2 protein [Bifidobacterium simiarum]
MNLSVSIVVYNDFSDVKKAVASIEEMTPKTISKKIFIVDNSDKESGQRDFRKFIEPYPDVKYVSADGNIGFGRGHNLVLNQLDSDYHAIVNPDIILKEDAFSKLIDFMEKRPDVGMCIPRIETTSGELQAAYRKELTVLDMVIRMVCPSLFPKRMKDHTLQHMDYSKPFDVPFGQGSFLVIRTPLYQKLGGFDDDFFLYLEDADLCKRVNAVSKLEYCPYATVTHKWMQGSHKNIKLLKLHVQSMIHYFNKWGWKLA